jgi:hypothetical protein
MGDRGMWDEMHEGTGQKTWLKPEERKTKASPEISVWSMSSDGFDVILKEPCTTRKMKRFSK